MKRIRCQDREIQTITLIVPVTKSVRRNLKRSRQSAGTDIMVIEDGGVSARAGLVKSNQFPREKCSRNDCLVCFQEDGESRRLKCDQSNVGYESEYTRCSTKYTYIGESSRTAYTRFGEHH